MLIDWRSENIYNFVESDFEFSIHIITLCQVLLYAPAFGITFYKHCGFRLTVALVAWCGIIQLALGAPFLLHAPINYISKSFEFSRVFFYKWTVNLKFLSEDVFLSQHLSHLLLLCTVLAWSFVAYRILKVPVKAFTTRHCVNLCFTCNFIGVVFARTLHYQFYSWYFFSIPALCVFADFTHIRVLSVPLPLLEVLVVASIEFAFNVYPATSSSSLILQMAHIILLLGLLKHYYWNVGRK